MGQIDLDKHLTACDISLSSMCYLCLHHAIRSKPFQMRLDSWQVRSGRSAWESHEVTNRLLPFSFSRLWHWKDLYERALDVKLSRGKKIEIGVAHIRSWLVIPRDGHDTHPFHSLSFLPLRISMLLRSRTAAPKLHWSTTYYDLPNALHFTWFCL